MQLGRDNNSVLVVDSGPSVLLSIDLTTGDRTPITESNFVLFAVDTVVLDSAGNHALTGNSFDFGSIVAIDLTTGDISTVSGFDNESSARIGSGPELGEPVAMIVDAANNRLQVLDSAVRGVFAVDLATGNQVITSWTDIAPQTTFAKGFQTSHAQAERTHAPGELGSGCHSLLRQTAALFLTSQPAHPM